VPHLLPSVLLVPLLLLSVVLVPLLLLSVLLVPLLLPSFLLLQLLVCLLPPKIIIINKKYATINERLQGKGKKVNEQVSK